MKSLKITLVALILITSGILVKADGSKKSYKLSMKYAVTTYIDAFIYGKIAGLEEILDANVKLTTSRGNSIITYNKMDIVHMLKSTKDVEQNCKTSYSVIENLPSQVIVKVNMKYNAFTRINYVTMAQTGKGWKVTNISSMFEA